MEVGDLFRSANDRVSKFAQAQKCTSTAMMSVCTIIFTL